MFHVPVDKLDPSDSTVLIRDVDYAEVPGRFSGVHRAGFAVIVVSSEQLETLARALGCTLLELWPAGVIYILNNTAMRRNGPSIFNMVKP